MKALLGRVKNLLLSPGAEWEAIEKEDVPPRRLALGYVTPLATIPVIATIVGLAIIGVDVGGSVYRAPAPGVVLSSLLFFALSILGVFLFALIVNWLAPRFGGQASFRQAFKVAAYSITAAMLAGALTIFPALGIFALLGATYSLYLLFVGAPKVMHVTGIAGINYSIVTTFIALLLGLGVGLAAMAASASNGAMFPSLAQLRGLSTDPSNPVPAGAALNLGPAPLPDAAGELTDGSPAVATGGDLRGVTPAKIASLNRVAVSAERKGLAGARTVEVEAEYRQNNRYLVLQIIYSPTIATTIGFGGSATSEYDRETADGYSRRRRVSEAIVVEDWNNASRTGSYGRLIEDKFYVKASGGGGILPNDLRAAVELFGRQTLAQMQAES